MGIKTILCQQNKYLDILVSKEIYLINNKEKTEYLTNFIIKLLIIVLQAVDVFFLIIQINLLDVLVLSWYQIIF